MTWHWQRLQMGEKNIHIVLCGQTELMCTMCYLHRTTNKTVQDQDSGASEVIKLKLFSKDALGIHETEKALVAMATAYHINLVFRWF